MTISASPSHAPGGRSRNPTAREKNRERSLRYRSSSCGPMIFSSPRRIGRREKLNQHTAFTNNALPMTNREQLTTLFFLTSAGQRPVHVQHSRPATASAPASRHDPASQVRFRERDFIRHLQPPVFNPAPPATALLPLRTAQPQPDRSRAAVEHRASDQIVRYVQPGFNVRPARFAEPAFSAFQRLRLRNRFRRR